MDGQEVNAQDRRDPVEESAPAPEVAVEAAPAPPQDQKQEAVKGGPRAQGLENLQPGMKLKGRVRNIVTFGAFVDIGVGRDGLLHISVLKRAGLDKTLKVGDTLDVVVRRIEPEDNRISLTLPAAEQSSKTPLRALQPDTVVKGRVVRLVDFGAFIDIGAQTDGLLHVSQMPWGYVNHPSEVLHVGDEVEVRILEVDPRKRRISLTMKELDAAAEGTPAKQPASEPPAERALTAFAVAFEKARAEAQRRQRQARK